MWIEYMAFLVAAYIFLNKLHIKLKYEPHI